MPGMPGNDRPSRLSSGRRARRTAGPSSTLARRLLGQRASQTRPRSRRPRLIRRPAGSTRHRHPRR
jgi:hypothetical protein